MSVKTRFFRFAGILSGLFGAVALREQNALQRYMFLSFAGEKINEELPGYNSIYLQKVYPPQVIKRPGNRPTIVTVGPKNY